MMEPNKVFKLWPKQLDALHSPAQEILYGGAAGPGKSHLLRVALIAWAMAVPGLQCYLFRRAYRDLIQGHMEGPTGFKSMLAEAEAAGLVQIVELEIRFKNGPQGGFEGGSRISLNHCQHENDCLSYKTIEFHVLAIEEATEFTEFMIRFLRSRVRMPEIMQSRIPDNLKGRFPRCLYATNPGGPGHAYFKRAFVDARPPGEIWIAPDEDGGFSRQFISAKLSDNPSVNPNEYRKRLQGIGSPAYVEALLDGNWEAALGAYFPEFAKDKHVVPDFLPPDHWFRFRTFDWGDAEPFGVYWWAVSDGETFIDNHGDKRWFPRGALIAYREWYGCNEYAPSQGLRMRNEDIAEGIKARTLANETHLLTLTDSLPFQTRGNVGNRICDIFERDGVPLIQGDTARISGWSQMRARLIGVELDDSGERHPMIYFCESCPYVINYIPMLAYHPSPTRSRDAQESGEATHACDCVRLACTARAKIKEAPAKPLDPAKLSNKQTFDQVLKQVQRGRRVSSGY